MSKRTRSRDHEKTATAPVPPRNVVYFSWHDQLPVSDAYEVSADDYACASSTNAAGDGGALLRAWLASVTVEEAPVVFEWPGGNKR